MWRACFRGVEVEPPDADPPPPLHLPPSQDISIDVYGRGDKSDAVDGGLDAAKTGAEAGDAAPAVGRARVAKAAAAKGGEDDLDSLLGL